MHFIVQSAVLRSHVVRLSVRLSVTMVDCDHIGWKSWKLIECTDYFPAFNWCENGWLSRVACLSVRVCPSVCVCPHRSADGALAQWYGLWKAGEIKIFGTAQEQSRRIQGLPKFFAYPLLS